MAQITIRDLVAVSNNSQLTNIVANTLNEKLDDKEKRDFLDWLRLVRNEIQMAENKGKRRGF